MFSLFNFSLSIFQGVSWPHLPPCADAHGWTHTYQHTYRQTTILCHATRPSKWHGLSQATLSKRDNIFSHHLLQILNESAGKKCYSDKNTGCRNGTARRFMSVEILSTGRKTTREIAFEKACNEVAKSYCKRRKTTLTTRKGLMRYPQMMTSPMIVGWALVKPNAR